MARKNDRRIMDALFLAACLSAAGCGFTIGTRPNGDAALPYKNPIGLPRDGDGWTRIEPSSDSLIAYVSAAEGDDASAETCASGEAGADPFRPTGPIHPFASYAAAREAVRDGYPDWILFRRGETYPDLSLSPISGRDADELSLIGSYGDGDLPVLNPVQGRDLITASGYAMRYFAVMGLDCYAAAHDPGNYAAGTVPPDAACGFSLVKGDGAVKTGLFEGCRFRCFGNNVIQAYGSGSIGDIAIRRCSFLDNFHSSRENGHSQGIFAGRIAGLFMEECVFDHNGWYSQDDLDDGTALAGEATMFNHNTYFADCSDITFRNNVFLRSSSINNKFTANIGEACASNIAVLGNLYVDGEIGISIGGNEDIPYKFKDIVISGNVFTEIGRSRPTNRTLGWGLDIADWDGGEASGNYFIHNTTPPVDNTYGINVSGGTRDVLISGNVIYGQNETGTNPWSCAIAVDDRATKERVIISGNAFQEPSGSIVIARFDAEAGPNGILFRGNDYFLPGGDLNGAFVINGASVSPAQWRSATGDTSRVFAVSFADPSRGIAAYQASIDATASIDAFIEACREQYRDGWNGRYSAQAVSAWLIAGFAR